MQTNSLTFWIVVLISVISVKIGFQNLQWAIHTVSSFVTHTQPSQR
jgi:hypothetical protein